MKGLFRTGSPLIEPTNPSAKKVKLNRISGNKLRYGT
jgi:hypothetical protein